MPRLVYLTILCCFVGGVIAGPKDVEVISVTGKGISVDRGDALAKALTEAIGKVNPTALSALNSVKTKSVRLSSSSNGQRESSSLSEKVLSREFSQATRGILKRWDILNERMNGQMYEVIVSAEVLRLKDSPQLDRKRISVIEGSDGDPQLNQIAKESLEEALVKSRKFAVLQNNDRDDLLQFIDDITSRGRIEDLVRVQGVAAPEVVVVISIKDLAKAGSRMIGKVSVEVIDYSSGQIKYKHSKPVTLRSRDQVRNQVLIGKAGSELSRQLLAHIYPPLVVGWNGMQMTLGLGDGFFTVGDTVEIKESIGGIRDRYTGEFLEDNLVLRCKAVVRSVGSRVSIASPRGDCGAPFITGSVEALADLETKIFVASRISYEVPSSLSNSTSGGGGSSRSSSSRDFDGLFKTD